MLQNELIASGRGNTGPIRPNKAVNLDQILSQVATDLQSHLQSATDLKKKLRVVSEKTGIHQKTLSRIIKLENKPTPATVFRIYSYLTQGLNETDILSKSPEIINKYLSNYLELRLEKNITYQPSYIIELQSNPVFAEIYVLCSTGLLSVQDISKRFGNYGVQLAEEMLAKKIIQQHRSGFYTLGQLQIHLSPECILSLGLLTAKNYAKPQSGHEYDQHFMGFVAESLSDEAYLAWLKIDTEAHQQKMAIAKQPKNAGTNRVFTFNVTDTLIPRELS